MSLPCHRISRVPQMSLQSGAYTVNLPSAASRIDCLRVRIETKAARLRLPKLPRVALCDRPGSLLQTAMLVEVLGVHDPRLQTAQVRGRLEPLTERTARRAD